MDLGLFAAVLWRSRFLVLIGVLAAVALAVFASARVEVDNGRPKLVYRTPVIYASTVQLLVTQRGFPEGRSVFDDTLTTEPSGQVVPPKFADPSRFSSLAVLYSQLIMGNEERLRVFGPRKPLYRDILASPMPTPNLSGGFLPIIQITGIAPSPVGAMKLADRAASSFSTYLRNRQSQTAVPKANRVVLDRIAGPLHPVVYQGRKKVRSIFAFMVILMITIAAAFVRENLRSRSKIAVPDESAHSEESAQNGQREIVKNPSTMIAHDP